MMVHPTNEVIFQRASIRSRAGRALPFVASLMLAAAPALGAQDVAVGRIQGTIKEAARPRGVKGASVLVARLDPDPPLAFGAKPDREGRYHFDSLPVGRYMIQLAHEALDSLELSLPALEVFITAGRRWWCLSPCRRASRCATPSAADSPWARRRAWGSRPARAGPRRGSH